MLRLITRESRLALIQVLELKNLMPGTPFEIITVKSYGDKHKDIFLDADTPQDFFTVELDNALLEGKADIALHSAKDIPFPMPEELELIALTLPEDQTDALVGQKLANLKKGQRVGTSSPLRRAQLLQLRPDLITVPIRGTIDERLAYIDRGEIDSLVVATCALKRLGLEHRIAEVLPFHTHPLQGMLGVVARRRRPGLAALFAPIDRRRYYGKVYLIGAGPGAPDLLTIRGQNILEKADIILYDDLLDTAMLRGLHGEKIYVGKRKGKHHKEQDEINRLLLQYARNGKLTVRLKGGDPMVFGRAGEEIGYLMSNQVSVEVVPGITSALAASASLLSPMTFRGLSNSVTFRNGHGRLPEVPYLPHDNEIWYMSATQKKKITRHLIVVQGRNPETSALLIRNVSRPDEKAVSTTIENLEKTNMDSPLLILVGTVASTIKTMRKVLFTGLSPEYFPLQGKIIRLPFISIKALPVPNIRLQDYTGFVFCSRNAVEIFFSRFHPPEASDFYCIGPKTADKLRFYGYTVTAIPERYDSEHFAQLLQNEAHDKKLLYPCSDISRNKLHDLPFIDSVPFYTTHLESPPKINLNDIDAIVFTSSSTIHAFFKQYKKIPNHILIYVSGQKCLDTILKYPVKEAHIATLQTL